MQLTLFSGSKGGVAVAIPPISLPPAPLATTPTLHTDWPDYATWLTMPMGTLVNFWYDTYETLSAPFTQKLADWQTRRGEAANAGQHRSCSQWITHLERKVEGQVHPFRVYYEGGMVAAQQYAHHRLLKQGVTEDEQTSLDEAVAGLFHYVDATSGAMSLQQLLDRLADEW